MKIVENYCLKEHNTLGFNVSARYFAAPGPVEDLKSLLTNPDFANTPKMVIGSGSNILFSKDFEGLLIHPSMVQIKIVKNTEKYVYLRVGAGVVWDDLVSYTVDRGWGGVENLSWIPGCVGAAPVQNIGAYGVEAKDAIFEVEFVDMQTGKEGKLTAQECNFGYRDSIFKRELKSKVVITFVTFRLDKFPVINSKYADVNEALEAITVPSLHDVRNIIIDIRKRKLPDPTVIGNAGSFFKNPVVRSEFAQSLQDANPTLKLFPAAPGFSKIPAAWLIEQCGFKGKKFGNVGVHDKQPLVLLAYEGAKGEELIELSSKIRLTVKERFGIEIEPEVNFC